jgi:potassium channel LctB
MKDTIENTGQEKNKNIAQKIGNWALDHFFRTFAVLAIINFILFTSGKSVPLIISIVAFLLLTLYILIFMIRKIRYHIYKLLNHELTFKSIVIGYVTSAIFIILLFSIVYTTLGPIGIGELRYGSCIDNIELTKESIDQDAFQVRNFGHSIYFSTITFFTVGYGDICPMGVSKIVAALNAFVGNAFTVIILAIAITNYSNKKIRDEKNKND